VIEGEKVRLERNIFAAGRESELILQDSSKRGRKEEILVSSYE